MTVLAADVEAALSCGGLDVAPSLLGLPHVTVRSTAKRTWDREQQIRRARADLLLAGFQLRESTVTVDEVLYVEDGPRPTDSCVTPEA